MTGPVLRLWDGYDHTTKRLRNEVFRLQEALGARGFPVQVDGYFGKATQEMVERFQERYNLVADGIVGPHTWAALDTEPNGGNADAYFETTYSSKNPQLNTHLKESVQYKEMIQAAAQDTGICSCVIWGIGSRESGWGTESVPHGPAGTGDMIPRKSDKPWRSGALPPDGMGFGRGLMQIDYDSHEFARTENRWKDPEHNILYGARLLRLNLDIISRRYSHIGNDMKLRAAIAAYNCGAGNAMKTIDMGKDIDYFTAGRDYSYDVLSRSGWFQISGWLKDPTQ